MDFEQIMSSQFRQLGNDAARSLKGHAFIMSRDCSQPFRELIDREVHSLTELPAPTTFKGVAYLQLRAQRATSKVSAVANANFLAERFPENAQRIFAITRQFCEEYPVTGDCTMGELKLSNELLEIQMDAASHRMMHLRELH